MRPVSGKAGQAMVKLSSSASSSASATGPMLPASVESKVEQYLKKNCWQPACCSQRSAASDCSTACSAGQLRDFNAITSASASGAVASAPGRSISCTVRMPCLTRVLHRSVAPVKSSAIHPSSGIRFVPAPGAASPDRLRSRPAVGTRSRSSRRSQARRTAGTGKGDGFHPRPVRGGPAPRRFAHGR